METIGILTVGKYIACDVFPQLPLPRSQLVIILLIFVHGSLVSEREFSYKSIKNQEHWRAEEKAQQLAVGTLARTWTHFPAVEFGSSQPILLAPGNPTLPTSPDPQADLHSLEQHTHTPGCLCRHRFKNVLMQTTHSTVQVSERKVSNALELQL